MSKRQLNKQQAFNEEILPHLDSLYNFALRLTTDPSDSEDLVQDTIVKAFRFFDSYEKPPILLVGRASVLSKNAKPQRGP